MEEAAKIFLQQGVVGAMLVVLGIMYYRKEQECQAKEKANLAEKDARIADAKAYNATHSALHERVLTAIDKLSELMEIWERREHERVMAELHSRRGGSSPDPEPPSYAPAPPPLPPRRGGLR
jgi:hypothetical protein